MAKQFTTEELQQFIQNAENVFAEFIKAQAILASMPDLAREAFGFSNSRSKEVIDSALSRVIHRVNSNFFMGKVNADEMIPFCANTFYELQSTRIDMNTALEINKLLINDVNHADVLVRALNDDHLKEPKFKSVMRLNESRTRNDVFIADVVYIASKELGFDVDIPTLKKQISYLSKGDEVEFDVGITVALAKNGNTTIKLDKNIVEKLNSMLPQ